MTEATFKQIRFIKFLASDKGFRDEIAARMQWDGQPASVSGLSIREASEMIDWLKSLPAKVA